MALDKFVDSSQLNGALTSTADAIRAKTGGSSLLDWDMDTGFSVAVGDIVTLPEGSDDANATASDILNGKTAYVKGVKVTGNISSRAAATITPGTTAQEIAAGVYLSGKQTIAGDADLVTANIKKDVNIFGVVGTFTTTPSGKTALTAAALRSGYAGFINGTQVNGSMPNASFANTATSGKTYTDISSSAPVLVAGDYLYINEGYTGYQKISLAKLVPDGSDVKGHDEYILSGHSAYDNDGTLVAGSIQTLAATDITVNGGTVTIPLGKYTGASDGTAITKSIDNGSITASVSSNVNGSASMTATGFTAASSATSYYVTLSTTSGSVKAKAQGSIAGYITTSTSDETSAASVSVSGNGTKLYIPSGAYSASVSSHSVTTPPIVTGKILGTVTNIGTTTKPSGTDGTNYWTITPSGSVTATGVSTAKGKATIGTAGYLATGNKESNASTANITPSILSGSERYIVKGAVIYNTSGGTSSGTINRGSQIKIGAGYYPSDLYYTAQANSGTRTITTSGTISCNGYLNVSVGSGEYNASTIELSVVGPDVTCSTSGTITNISTTTKPSGTDGTDYWTIKPGGSVNSVGNVSGKSVATISQSGWIVSGSRDSTFTSGDIYASISTQLPRYIVKGVVTNNTSLPSGSSSEGTINRGSYIKIGAGYYPSDLYYTSQANSGSLTLTTSHYSNTAISCDGYATVRVVGIKVGESNSFSVNNSGDTTITSDSATKGYLVVSAYNSSGTLESDKSIVSAGKWVNTDVTTSGTYYGRVVVPNTMLIPSGNIQLTQSTSTDVSAYATATVRGVTAAISGGGLSGTATASSSTATISDSTNTSGISFTTTCTATRAKVSCTASTAGWASGTIKELAQDTGTMTAKTYYINSVSLPKGKSFSITVYTGASTQTTFTFTTDANGNTVVTE